MSLGVNPACFNALGPATEKPVSVMSESALSPLKFVISPYPVGYTAFFRPRRFAFSVEVTRTPLAPSQTITLSNIRSGSDTYLDLRQSCSGLGVFGFAQ